MHWHVVTTYTVKWHSVICKIKHNMWTKIHYSLTSILYTQVFRFVLVWCTTYTVISITITFKSTICITHRKRFNPFAVGNTMTIYFITKSTVSKGLIISYRGIAMGTSTQWNVHKLWKFMKTCFLVTAYIIIVCNEFKSHILLCYPSPNG